MTEDEHRHERERQERQGAEERAAMGAAAMAAELEAEDEVEKTAETAEADSGAETVGDERNSATQAEIEALSNRLERTLVELENLHKRSEREKAQMFDLGAKSVFEEFLPIIDNSECGVTRVPEGEDSGVKAYTEGMGTTYRQLLKSLKEAGVEVVDAKDKPLDPAYHSAVIHGDNEVLSENVVSEEL